ncbi:MAG: hypothetical protein WBA16_08695 [Nonlabens sp.]
MKKLMLSMLVLGTILVGCKDNEVGQDSELVAVTNDREANNWEYNNDEAQESGDPISKDNSNDGIDSRSVDEQTTTGAKSNSFADQEYTDLPGMNTVNEKSIKYTFTRAESDKIAADFEKNVELDAANNIRIKNYPTYTLMRGYARDFSKSDESNEAAREQTLRSSFEEFKRTIPTYLLRNDVKDAIRDVNKELTKYEMDMKAADATRKQNRKNMESIQEAFDDLEKEIMQARKKFMDNRADALEEFMEEINDKGNQTKSERYKDAIEEYNEEIED